MSSGYLVAMVTDFLSKLGHNLKKTTFQFPWKPGIKAHLVFLYYISKVNNSFLKIPHWFRFVPTITIATRKMLSYHAEK